MEFPLKSMVLVEVANTRASVYSLNVFVHIVFITFVVLYNALKFGVSVTVLHDIRMIRAMTARVTRNI